MRGVENLNERQTSQQEAFDLKRWSRATNKGFIAQRCVKEQL